MSDLSFTISPVTAGPAAPASGGSGPITLKINGLPYMFDPSTKETPDRMPQVTVKTGAFVLPPVFTRRQETPSLNPQNPTAYHIELEELQSTDSDGKSEVEEPLEPVDEEAEEKDESEDLPFTSDQKPGMQDKDFLNEEDPRESIYELMTEGALFDHKARKMWQKARLALLEALQKKSKNRPVEVQSEAVSYFFLLLK